MTKHRTDATGAPSVAPEPDEQPARAPPHTPVAVGAGTPDGIRRYAVYRGSFLLGTTNLEVAVEPGMRAAGVFHPTPAFAAVRDVFALYHRAANRNDRRLLREFVRQRDQLYLRVWRAGVELDARVELISTWSLATCVIHVASQDERLWRWRFPDS